LLQPKGVASSKKINNIYKYVLKTPMGPFEQMDVVGLDIALAIEEHYAECRNDLPS
jgi:3-hydroxyacyl-CoA dehydrogenase